MSSPSYIELHQSSVHSSNTESDENLTTRNSQQNQSGNHRITSLPKLSTAFGLCFLVLLLVFGLIILHAMLFINNEHKRRGRDYLNFPTIVNLAFGSCTAYDLRQVYTEKKASAVM